MTQNDLLEIQEHLSSIQVILDKYRTTLTPEEVSLYRYGHSLGIPLPVDNTGVYHDNWRELDDQD